MDALNIARGGASDARERPPIEGWGRVAAAVHSMRQLSVPMLLTIVASAMPPMWVDFSSGRYFWEPELSDLPSDPGEVTVYSQPIEPGNPPYPWVAWRPMDPMLWQIGHHAFAAGRAEWMRAGDRYALQRWPNLTEIPHADDEIRMIATLANGYLTAQELGLLTGAGEQAAHRVLDKLSLIGAIKTASGPLAPPTAVVTPSAPPREASRGRASDRGQRFGLFEGLRDRLGGGR